MEKGQCFECKSKSPPCLKDKPMRGKCRMCKHVKKSPARTQEDIQYRITVQVYNKATASSEHYIEELCEWCFGTLGRDIMFRYWDKL